MHGNRTREIIERQIGLIAFIDETMYGSEDERLKYTIAGGWAVDGIVGEITRAHENVDVMVPRNNLEKVKYAMRANDMKLWRNGKNIHATDGNLVADVVVLYPVGDEYIFDTPYHNPGTPLFQRFFKGKRVKIPQFEFANGHLESISEVEFTALNPTTLYYAKITAAKLSKRDIEDAKRLAPYVDKGKREQIRAYAKI
jgi:hypothetical protein